MRNELNTDKTGDSEAVQDAVAKHQVKDDSGFN